MLRDGDRIYLVALRLPHIAVSNPAAVQTRGTAFSGDITVSVGSFSTVGGANQRLVADTNYQGNVTVTLAVAS